MEKDKPYKILEKVNERFIQQNIFIDGKIINSKRGVPYLWLSHNDYNFSICYFGGERCLKVWSGCGTIQNKFLFKVKQWTEVIDNIKKYIKD